MGWERNYNTFNHAQSMRRNAQGLGVGYQGMAGAGLTDEANDIQNNINAGLAQQAQQGQQDAAREAHERSLQMAEQQRRQYDSETARESQKQKYGVLGGLLGGMGGMRRTVGGR